MRKVSLLGGILAINFATVGMGKYIDGAGKLAPSNVAPIIFLAIAMPMFLMLEQFVKKGLVGFLLLFNMLSWLSFVIFLFRYGWEPNVPVMLFQELEVLFVAVLIWYGRRNSHEFRAVVHFGTLCSALITAAYAADQMRASYVFLTLSMDDKSQAAVLCCCQAFILVRYFGGLIDCLVAALLMVFAFLTLSRLPVFFVPVLYLSLALGSRGGRLVAAASLVAIVIAAVSYGDLMIQVFKVFDRLASIETVQGDDATSSHVLLLKYGLEMKFTDLTAFLFGIGPGNFSKALISFPISTQALDAIDPQLISEARLGRAPMHSTPMSLLLDYNIWLFAFLGYMLVKAVRYLLLHHYYVELMFFATLLAASMFYSIHNKPFFFLFTATVFLLAEIAGGRRGPPRDTSHAHGV